MPQNAQERVTAFRKTMADAKANLAKLDLMQEEIRQIESVETSPDRSVTVVAGPSGAVRSITFTEAALSQGAAALSRLTTTTFQQAVAKAARMQAEIVQRYVGDKVDVVGKVNKIQEELANPPEPQDGFQLTKSSQQDSLVFNDEQAMEQQQAPQHLHPPTGPAGPAGLSRAQPPAPAFQPPRQPSRPPTDSGYDDWDPLRPSGEPSAPRHASNPQRPAPSRRPADDVPEDDSYDFHLE